MNKKEFRGLYNFNKQLVFGEIGAMILSPLFAKEASLFWDSYGVISFGAVVGAVIGAAIFWILTKMYDLKNERKLSSKKMMQDIAYFTPAAFILTLGIYYPLLFFLSKIFIKITSAVIYPVFFAQAIAFIVFLLAVNIYRMLLKKYLGKVI